MNTSLIHHAQFLQMNWFLEYFMNTYHLLDVPSDNCKLRSLNCSKVNEDYCHVNNNTILTILLSIQEYR